MLPSLIAVPLVVVLGGTLLLALRFNLPAETFYQQIDRLIAADNRSRAIKLCMAAPNVPVARVVRKGLELELAGDYANAEQLEGAAVEALVPLAEQESKRFMPLVWLAGFGVGPALGLFILPEGNLMMRIAGAAAVLLLAANHVRYVLRMRREVYAAVGAVAPHVRAKHPVSEPLLH